MRKVSLKELYVLACASYRDVWDAARRNGRDVKIYLHWTAGRYNSLFEDYHVNINGDGEIFVSTDDFSEILYHTWRRNSGAIGVSLCAGYNATSNWLGAYAPTDDQIETLAKVGCILADAYDLTIDKNRVMTHGEAADNEDGLDVHEPYGPKNGCERWDLEYLGTPESPDYNPWATDGSRGGDVLRGKMNWYRSQGILKTLEQ